MEKISVFLSDWQVLFREGIHFTLSGEEDFEVIGEDTANEEAVNFIERNPPRVAILNANWGKPSGIEVARRLHKNLPEVSVILVMDSDDEEQLFAAMKSGASACITKNIDPDDLVNIIRKVAQGGYLISEGLLRPGIVSRVLEEFESFSVVSEQVENLLARLTPGEGEILRHLAEGSSSQQVSQALGISEEAISHQLDLIQHKLITNERDLQVIEAAQRSSTIVSTAKLVGKPTVEYVTREEFEIFKENLRERFKSFIGELR